jgi:hypothetical protein
MAPARSRLQYPFLGVTETIQSAIARNDRVLGASLLTYRAKWSAAGDTSDSAIIYSACPMNPGRALGSKTVRIGQAQSLPQFTNTVPQLSAATALEF